MLSELFISFIQRGFSHVLHEIISHEPRTGHDHSFDGVVVYSFDGLIALFKEFGEGLLMNLLTSCLLGDVFFYLLLEEGH